MAFFANSQKLALKIILKVTNTSCPTVYICLFPLPPFHLFPHLPSPSSFLPPSPLSPSSPFSCFLPPSLPSLPPSLPSFPSFPLFTLPLSLPPSLPLSLCPFSPHSSNNQIILGTNNINVPIILAIIATVCEEGALEEDEQVLMRLLSIARHVQVRVYRRCCRD